MFWNSHSESHHLHKSRGVCSLQFSFLIYKLEESNYSHVEQVTWRTHALVSDLDMHHLVQATPAPDPNAICDEMPSKPSPALLPVAYAALSSIRPQLDTHHYSEVIQFI